MSSKILPKLRVVFDLDECLIKSISKDSSKVTFNCVPKTKVHIMPKLKILGSMEESTVIERPHLLTGLDMIKDSKKAEIFLFTAGTKDYAKEALNFIDPNRTYFTKVWSREDCTNVNYNYTKDLNKLGEDYIPERTILIDNQSYSSFLQPENGYLIEHFEPKRSRCYKTNSIVVGSYEDDNHLLIACEFITKQLLDEADVRKVLKKKFSLRAVHKKEYEFDLKTYTSNKLK